MKNQQAQAIEMTNVKHEVKGDQLIITVDLSPAKGTGLSLTSKGRSYSVATSNGFQKLAGEFQGLGFSVNVIADKAAYEAHVASLVTPTAPAAAPAPAAQSAEIEAMKAQMNQMQQMMAQLLQMQMTKA